MVKTYTTATLINTFSKWYNQAQQSYNKHKIPDFNAFSLSTVYNNQPTSRTVLLKSFNTNGFVFFTNYNSAKGNAIKHNSNVAMLFYWPILSQQIRILGTATAVDTATSQQYFNSRPYLSKIGAWASKQSSAMENSGDLHKQVIKYTAKFKTNVPYPEHWGGFCINPHYIEFWQEKPFRLHKREAFTKQGDEWTLEYLYP